MKNNLSAVPPHLCVDEDDSSDDVGGYVDGEVAMWDNTVEVIQDCGGASLGSSDCVFDAAELSVSGDLVAGVQSAGRQFTFTVELSV